MVSSDDEAPESIDNRAIKEKILGDKRSADKAVAQAKQEAKLKRRNLDERLKKQKEEKRQKTAAVALPAPLPQELLDTVAQEEMESAQRYAITICWWVLLRYFE
jgi:hypothetical protein